MPKSQPWRPGKTLAASTRNPQPQPNHHARCTIAHIPVAAPIHSIPYDRKLDIPCISLPGGDGAQPGGGPKHSSRSSGPGWQNAGAEACWGNDGKR